MHLLRLVRQSLTEKGSATPVHTLDTAAPPGRCPDLTDVGTRAATRQPGKTAKEYLIESAYEPHKFLVPGYGTLCHQSGSRRSVYLSWKSKTVIAFLQSQGGEVDLTPFEPPVDIGSAEAIVEELPPPPHRRR